MVYLDKLFRLLVGVHFYFCCDFTAWVVCRALLGLEKMRQVSTDFAFSPCVLGFHEHDPKLFSAASY